LLAEYSAVSLRDRKAEKAKVGDTANDVVRYIQVFAMDGLGVRRDVPGREVAKRRSQQSMLVAGSEVFSGASLQQKLGYSVKGWVEGFRGDIGIGAVRNRGRQVVTGSLGPETCTFGGS
jgi:hypothetical protein